MDRSLQETWIDCPYCWESISVLLNPEDLGEQYIEDCQVCCRPIEFLITQAEDGELTARVSSDAD
ncbi:MAG: CPXCG motif-containing cysteine-rich protein [Luminiphilus sp.]|nr:CPXCG motif-containing cysteine-rich protein [Luminiphilus sp.]